VALLSYIFYNLSNVILIALISENNISQFLNFYSIASGIFSFIIFYNFSKKIFLKIYLVNYFSVALFICNGYFQNIFISTFHYVFILLYADYYYSLSKKKITNLVFKIILFISTFLILFELKLIVVLQIKVFLILIFLFFLQNKDSEFRKLEVNSPILYSLATCIIYFGSLFIISILASSDVVKFFYISMQFFIGFKLKFFDLEIRKINFNLNYKKFKFNLVKLNSFFNYSSIIFFLFISIYFSHYIFFPIFLISLILLENVKAKFIT